MHLDLGNVFSFTVSPLELAVRASLMYWFLFLVFRFILRRDVGSLGVGDFLFVVLLGDASQNGMVGEATSSADCMLVLGTLVAWNVLIDVLAWRFPTLERALKPSRLCLVRDGQLQRRAMRREFVTEDELMTQVRSQGVDDLSRVKRVWLESNGDLSVIQRD